MEPIKSKGGRPPKKEPLASSGKSVKLLPEVHQVLGKTAKNFKMSNSDFTSACIAYFVESGLDPRKASKVSLAKVEGRVVREALGVRENNANIGNRLVSIIRVFEKSLGDFLQKQQGGTIAYLERIERNILTHLVSQEDNIFSPLLERVIRNGVEGQMTRVISQVLALQLKGQKFAYSEVELQQTTLNYDQQRDSQLVVESRRILDGKKMERPKLSARPELATMTRPPAPAKPATTAGTQPTGAGLAAAPTAAPVAPRP